MTYTTLKNLDSEAKKTSITRTAALVLLWGISWR